MSGFDGNPIPQFWQLFRAKNKNSQNDSDGVLGLAQSNAMLELSMVNYHRKS